MISLVCRMEGTKQMNTEKGKKKERAREANLKRLNDREQTGLMGGAGWGMGQMSDGC